MAFTGMSVEGVRSLASQMDNSAGEIEGIIGKLTGALGGTEWVGNDATKFRSDWESMHTQALRNVAEQLKATATTARGNADQQEAASA